MNIERERKFLVKYLPDLTEEQLLESVNITQAYLPALKNKEVRLRIYESEKYPPAAIITHKSLINKTDRFENEYAIPLDEAYTIINEKKYLHLLTKVRHYIGDWEIDVYPNGLIVAEYEYFETDSFPKVLPDWIGEEITGIKEYSNFYIAQNFEKFS